jgi:hypothetical protein
MAALDKAKRAHSDDVKQLAVDRAALHDEHKRVADFGERLRQIETALGQRDGNLRKREEAVAAAEASAAEGRAKLAASRADLDRRLNLGRVLK